MKKLFLISLLPVLLMQVLSAVTIFKKPLSERITGYKIDAVLDPAAKTVTGVMDAFWVNKSAGTVPDVQLHMYLNAFRNIKSTFNKESGRLVIKKETDPGWIDIKSLTDRNGTDLTSKMQFISPDDGNPDDMTVLRIVLPEPVKPGDTLFLKINFESKLPNRIIRTGYNDNYFFVAQWFPKFGVYEPEGMRYSLTGSWNCHQFHSTSEFYSYHSVYDVKITLPKEYVVGTGGLLISETDAGEGKKTLTCRAEDIPDFAWTAWPGYAVFTDQWKDVKITLLLPPERKNQAERQFTAVKNALEYLAENIGPYPWPHLTFVDPPLKGSGAGGMEYTTLFTSESFLGVPAFLHIPEMVTIHEFGHAYFMGILASNEFEEPWLDEGINSFWEERMMDHYYGENSGMLDHSLLQISDKSMSRSSYIYSGSRQASSNREYSWNYPHGTYGMMSYNKTATWLYTLMGIVGEETTNKIFREYYRKWAFRHPSGTDFVNVVNEVVTKEHGNKFGTDMNWFFDQTLYGTGICDYRVSGLTSRKIETQKNKSEKSDSLKKDLPVKDSLFKSVVELERIGEVMLPVDVLVHFKNGEEVVELWDGRSRFKDYEYTGAREIEWVKIDPEFRIRMDVNYINNSMTLKPDRVPVRRMTDKFISVMQFFILALTL